MTSQTGIIEPPLLGMFELDGTDTVVYAHMEGIGPLPDLRGRGLFERARSLSNSDELRQRIHYFRSNGASADAFDFVCQYEGGEIPVRVLMARVRDFAGNSGTKSILVHIRQRC